MESHKSVETGRVIIGIYMKPLRNQNVVRKPGILVCAFRRVSGQADCSLTTCDIKSYHINEIYYMFGEEATQKLGSLANTTSSFRSTR